MAFAESIRGVVINVIDGDTVILLERTPEQMRTHRIRLEGIDTPERGQDGYEGAKEYLEKLIWGETVTVRYTENDRYGRILGEIWHGKMFVNEEMVKEGWAWIYKNFSASRKLEKRMLLTAGAVQEHFRCGLPACSGSKMAGSGVFALEPCQGHVSGLAR